MKAKHYFPCAIFLSAAVIAAAPVCASEDDFSFDADNYILTDYTGNETDVEIPDTLADCPVTEIGDNVFWDNDTVKSVSVPSSVHAVGRYVFNACEALSSVTLSEGLQVIDDGSFTSLPALRSITIPASVVYIGSGCFSDLGENAEITFAGEPPVFGVNCFAYLPESAAILVPSDCLEAYGALLPDGAAVSSSGTPAAARNTSFSPEEDFDFDAETGTITCYNAFDTVVRIPDTIGGVPVTDIGAGAFAGHRYCYYLEIPEGVTGIGEDAFDAAQHLLYADLPSTLRTIGSDAFSGYRGSTIGWSGGLVSIGAGAFHYAQLAGELRLPDGLVSIGPGAFEAAGRITDIYFPESLESIGENAFSGVTGIRYLCFDGAAMPSIAENALADSAERIADVDIAWDASRAELEAARELFTSLGAVNCTVWINNPVSAGVCEYPADGSSTFTESDGGFTWVTYDGDQEALQPFVDVTETGEGLFRDNTSIRKFYPHHCETFAALGAETFAGSSLEYIEMYDSITDIGERAFLNCVNLTDITLPESLLTIGNDAFEGCTGLSSVTVRCSLSALPDGIFRSCGQLLTVIIPGNELTEEEKSAFRERTGLKWYAVIAADGDSAGEGIRLMSETPADEHDFVIDEETGELTLYTGDAEDLVIPRTVNGVTVRKIGYTAFDRAADYSGTGVTTVIEDPLRLRSVVIPETVEELGDGAFEYCPYLESVICYGPLTTAGKDTFVMCPSLTDVTFVNGVRLIDNECFMDCPSLASVDYGSACEKIGERVFCRSGIASLSLNADDIAVNAVQDCENLTEIHFGSRVVSLAQYAVLSCADLADVYIEGSDLAPYEGGGILCNVSESLTVHISPDAPDDADSYLEKICAWGEVSTEVTVERDAA